MVDMVEDALGVFGRVEVRRRCVRELGREVRVLVVVVLGVGFAVRRRVWRRGRRRRERGVGDGILVVVWYNYPGCR